MHPALMTYFGLSMAIERIREQVTDACYQAPKAFGFTVINLDNRQCKAVTLLTSDDTLRRISLTFVPVLLSSPATSTLP